MKVVGAIAVCRVREKEVKRSFEDLITHQSSDSLTV